MPSDTRFLDHLRLRGPCSRCLDALASLAQLAVGYPLPAELDLNQHPSVHLSDQKRFEARHLNVHWIAPKRCRGHDQPQLPVEGRRDY